MLPQPLISVIIPVYNNATHIGRCIESVLNQSLAAEKYEIIVVDNNSSDGTPQVIQGYPVTLLYEREIQTSYAARNRGIRQAKGAILAFTDSDCVADPAWLEEILAAFEDPEVMAVRGLVQSIAPATLVERFSDRVSPLRNRVEQTGMQSMITANAAYRKSALLAVGLYDPRLYTSEDTAVGWRVQTRVGKALFQPKALIYHQHRTTVAGLFKQYHRYGFAEVLLYHRFHDAEFYQRSKLNPLKRLPAQLLAVMQYPFSFAWRVVETLLRRSPTERLFYPLLQWVIESANILGKLSACWLIWWHREELKTQPTSLPSEP